MEGVLNSGYWRHLSRVHLEGARGVELIHGGRELLAVLVEEVEEVPGCVCVCVGDIFSMEGA